MALNNSTASRFPEPAGSGDPFAMQLALSRDHARLVPMQRVGGAYEVHPEAEDWLMLPASRGFAGYGLGRALRMLLDVLRGLTALHDTFAASGEAFAHGEVALPNFRVDADGVCRVVPLTARHAAEGDLEPTAATLGHLAPERLLGEQVDARADVFSAGVLLWEALAGQRLFDESTGDAIIDRLMSGKLQMPQLPPELAWAIPLKAVAARALAVDPYQRFSDCAELATAIAIVARERVASHAEVASFFGAAMPCIDPPPPQEHPVPTQSSTFSAAGAPASGRRSTLAPLGPSSSRPQPPAAPVAAPHKSPFSALLLPKPAALPEAPALAARPDIEGSFPAFSAEVAAPRATLRPPLPVAAVLESVPLSAAAPASSESPASTLSAAAVAVPVLFQESDASEPTPMSFRPARTRRLWPALATCTVGAALVLAVSGHWNATPTQPPAAPLAITGSERAPELVAPPSEHQPLLSTPSASPTHAVLNNVSAPHAIEMHAAPRIPKSTAKARSTKAKDYGI